ncbi:MAG: OmpH family outer membrane protein [Candidatus Margulisiibacteriota bacterium]
MKKLTTLLAALIVFSLVFGTVVSALDLNSIGFIDVQKVFKGYKATAKAQDELSKKEADFKKDFEASQTKLEKAQKDGKSEEELEKMKEDLEKELSPKREELLRLNEKITTKLQLEIVSAVKVVAKKVGIDLVLDKQVIITGGMDLSDMVIAELNR